MDDLLNFYELFLQIVEDTITSKDIEYFRARVPLSTSGTQKTYVSLSSAVN